MYQFWISNLICPVLHIFMMTNL
ncbi:MAG: DUF2933 domain-containing protein [Balneola sp.]|nr:MAG: DUF2933 domain-containing protein [Balneola sp.]